MTIQPSLYQLYRDHKGKVTDKWTLYLEEWDRVLSPYRDRPVRLLEIGIQNGGSLEIWAKYFEHAVAIVGCDIDEACKNLRYGDPRISVIVRDANTDEGVTEIKALSDSFDIIIDDGSHQSDDVIRSFARYFPLLYEGGTYLVEDLHTSYWNGFNGGLHNPFSAMAFFKRIADVLNFEHWRTNQSRTSLLEPYAKSLAIQFDEYELARIHAVEIVNSCCIIKKTSPDKNLLGMRVVTGLEETVFQTTKTSRTSIHDVIADAPDNTNLDVFALIQSEQYLNEQLQKKEQIIAEQDEQAKFLFIEQERQSQIIHSLQKQQEENERVIAKFSDEKNNLARQLDNLNRYVDQREQILKHLNDTLLEIYSSTAWKIIKGMWAFRLRLAPKGSARERVGRRLFYSIRSKSIGLYPMRPDVVPETSVPSVVVQSQPEQTAQAYTTINVGKEPLSDYQKVKDPIRKAQIERFFVLVRQNYPTHNSITHFLLLPLLSTGGAELVAVNFIKTIQENNPNASVLLLVTDLNIVDESFELPSNVIFLNLIDFLGSTDTRARKLFVYDLITTIRPSVVHNINSSVMWELIIEKGDEIRNISKIYANIFCFQFNDDGSKTGYAEYYLRKAVPYLDGLVSDNKRFINDAIIEYGLHKDSAKFRKIYTPARKIGDEDLALVRNRLQRYCDAFGSAKRLRCIWAGRLDAQKKWDLFLSIVKNCDFCDFDMYGKSVVDEGVSIPDLPNLNYRGTFTSSRDVFLENEYDAFIFTSQWEGIPTILLDAGIYGVPIIAPSVGGVGEVVTDETGYVLNEKASVENYLEALRRIWNNPKEAAERASKMLDLILDQHSWLSFVRDVNELEQYLVKPEQC